LRLRLMWNQLANPFRVSVILGLVAWAYLEQFIVRLAESVPIGTYPNLALPADPSTLFLESLLSVFIIGLVTVPVAGAVALLTVPMNDDKRGILALFMTIFSFVPVLFLGFEAVAWIVQEWQLSTVLLVWAPIVWMMIRMLRRRRAGSGPT
jgi:hypothetical protein